MNIILIICLNPLKCYNDLSSVQAINLSYARDKIVISVPSKILKTSQVARPISSLVYSKILL